MELDEEDVVQVTRGRGAFLGKKNTFTSNKETRAAEQSSKDGSAPTPSEKPGWPWPPIFFVKQAISKLQLQVKEALAPNFS